MNVVPKRPVSVYPQHDTEFHSSDSMGINFTERYVWMVVRQQPLIEHVRAACSFAILGVSLYKQHPSMINFIQHRSQTNADIRLIGVARGVLGAPAPPGR